MRGFLTPAENQLEIKAVAEMLVPYLRNVSNSRQDTVTFFQLAAAKPLVLVLVYLLQEDHHNRHQNHHHNNGHDDHHHRLLHRFHHPVRFLRCLQKSIHSLCNGGQGSSAFLRGGFVEVETAPVGTAGTAGQPAPSIVSAQDMLTYFLALSQRSGYAHARAVLERYVMDMQTILQQLANIRYTYYVTATSQGLDRARINETLRGIGYDEQTLSKLSEQLATLRASLQRWSADDPDSILPAAETLSTPFPLEPPPSTAKINQDTINITNDISRIFKNTHGPASRGGKNVYAKFFPGISRECAELYFYFFAFLVVYEGYKKAKRLQNLTDLGEFFKPVLGLFPQCVVPMDKAFANTPKGDKAETYTYWKNMGELFKENMNVQHTYQKIKDKIHKDTLIEFLGAQRDDILQSIIFSFFNREKGQRGGNVENIFDLLFDALDHLKPPDE